MAAKIDDGASKAASVLKRQQAKYLNHATNTEHDTIN